MTQLRNPHALMCHECPSAHVKEDGENPADKVIVCQNDDSDHFNHILCGGHVMCDLGVDLLKN